MIIMIIFLNAIPAAAIVNRPIIARVCDPVIGRYVRYIHNIIFVMHHLSRPGGERIEIVRANVFLFFSNESEFISKRVILLMTSKTD